ncbi:hypothetical protein BDA96_03G189300 [Sorghum bicolor]|uniref:UBC core domain-containing protein n=1 Tax=Sorghum bicolor TaxID=4558 RepID=A0A921UMQ1_SORBI|nr:hypothetical protein BDA96_03G189300 [Sorghum bicolor]
MWACRWQGSICCGVYYPNIDLEGNVCLNILREDWKPVLNINTIVLLDHITTSQVLDLLLVHSEQPEPCPAVEASTSNSPFLPS